MSAMIVSRSPTMIEASLRDSEPRMSVTRATSAAGRTQTTGSSHARLDRAMTFRSWNSISPAVGS